MASSLVDNRPWVIVVVTASAGPYESIKVGSADFGAEGEALPQLRERVAREVRAELDRQVRALQALYQGKPMTTTKGASPTPATPAGAVAGVAASRPPAKEANLAACEWRG